ncbi:MAG: exopolysaccharide biosynthesis protein [Rickettsiales bacterium]|jgi:hypothetical protein|nr:exopolysaccharide biosynthesis protein [Rickettsiales bacterium]
MKYPGISGLFARLGALEGERVSLDQILGDEEGGPHFALFILALFSLIPTPAPLPVISIFFGILCCLVLLRFILTRGNGSMPKFLGRISMKKKTLDSTIAKIEPFFRRIETITRRRLNFPASRVLSYLMSVFLLVIAIDMLTPIPLLNAVPTISMLVTTFGLLNGDGLLVAAGLLIGVLSVFLTVKALVYSAKLILKFS